jgi:transposase
LHQTAPPYSIHAEKSRPLPKVKEYERLKADIGQIDAKQMAWHKGNECSRRLIKVPAIGPITASVMVMKVPDPGALARSLTSGVAGSW